MVIIAKIRQTKAANSPGSAESPAPDGLTGDVVLEGDPVLVPRVGSPVLDA